MYIFPRTGSIRCGSSLRAHAIVNVTHASGERVRHGRLTLSPEESKIISLSQNILMRYNIKLSWRPDHRTAAWNSDLHAPIQATFKGSTSAICYIPTVRILGFIYMNLILYIAAIGDISCPKAVSNKRGMNESGITF